MSWNNAKIACEELGENWILPTKKEGAPAETNAEHKRCLVENHQDKADEIYVFIGLWNHY